MSVIFLLSKETFAFFNSTFTLILFYIKIVKMIIKFHFKVLLLFFLFLLSENTFLVVTAKRMKSTIEHEPIEARKSSPRKDNKGNLFQLKCILWYEQDPGPPTDIEHCPPTLNLAKNDPRFTNDKSPSLLLNHFHNGAHASYRQVTPNANGSGQQCVYRRNGSLILGPPNGSSADLCSPHDFVSELRHIQYDVVPYENCCTLSRNKASCAKYFLKRPSDDGRDYQSPKPS